MSPEHAAALAFFAGKVAGIVTYEDEYNRMSEVMDNYTSPDDYLADFSLDRLRSEYLGLCALVNEARRLRPSQESIDLRSGAVADMLVGGIRVARVRVAEYPMPELNTPELLRANNKMKFEILTHDPSTIKASIGEMATLSLYDQAEVDVLIMGIKGRLGWADVVGRIKMKEDS